MRTLAPYAIDRATFAAMMGDCFEIVMRAASGKAIGDIDEDGNVTEWVDAPPEDRMRDAEYAFNKVAYESLRLLASHHAVEKAMGADHLSGDRFADYVGCMEPLMEEYEGSYEARKCAVEYELGIDDQLRYGED